MSIDNLQAVLLVGLYGLLWSLRGGQAKLAERLAALEQRVANVAIRLDRLTDDHETRLRVIERRLGLRRGGVIPEVAATDAAAATKEHHHGSSHRHP